MKQSDLGHMLGTLVGHISCWKVNFHSLWEDWFYLVGTGHSKGFLDIHVEARDSVFSWQSSLYNWCRTDSGYSKCNNCVVCGELKSTWSCNIHFSIDIQEFYEVTLLNTQKSCEQKLEEVNHMADKWEKSVSVQNSDVAHSACPVEEVSLMWCQPSNTSDIRRLQRYLKSHSKRPEQMQTMNQQTSKINSQKSKR